MAKKYYYNCPRGFSNEFDIITVDNHNDKEKAAMNDFLEYYRHSSSTNWDLHQISAARAKEIIMNERRTAHLDDIVGATDYITATEYFNF